MHKVHHLRVPPRCIHVSWLAAIVFQSACSGQSSPNGESSSTGGASAATGGALGDGGTGGVGPASGGAPVASGGEFGTGGVPTGGGFATGGNASAGGDASTGGDASSGGDATTGGAPGSGGDSAGVGGTVEGQFQPCPESGPCKILPLGDSITVGWGSTDYSSYRVELFRKARADDHDITFTGTKQDGPNTVDGVPFPRKHEGIAGETISQIQGRVDAALAEETPHIVLVHAGTNDVNFSPEGVEDRLPVLVDKLLEDLPDALIVVSNIIPFPNHSTRVSAFNATIPEMIQERADAGEHVIFVDQFDGYPPGTAELPDGVHPNDAGYARMAGKWYDAIEPYLR